MYICRFSYRSVTLKKIHFFANRKCVFNFLYNYLRNIYIQNFLSNERNFVPYPCHTTRSGFFFYVPRCFKGFETLKHRGMVVAGIACGEPCWLPCGLRSGKMTSRLAAVRDGVRDFEDKTGAIFPACFLAGWAEEPVGSKKNVTWFSRAGIAKDRWLKYDIKFYTHRRGLSKKILLISRRFVSVKKK